MVHVTANDLVVNFDMTSQRLENSSSNGRINSCEEKFLAVSLNGSVFTINIDDSYATTNYPSLLGISTSVAYNTDNGKAYYGKSGDLYSYDLDNGTSTFIATINVSGTTFSSAFPKMAFKDGKLFLGTDLHIAIVDPSSGSVIKSIPVTGVSKLNNNGGDFAFNSNGDLYNAGLGGVYRMTFNGDSTSVSATKITASNFPYTLTGLIFDKFDNLHVTTNQTPSRLIQVNVNNGSYSIVNTVTGRPVYDLTSLSCPEETPTDTDNDGVEDDLDEYPEDPDRAFNNYNPGENGFGTFAFEDLYPQKGDYDFNDVLVHYRHNFVTNASNKVVEIKSKYVVSSVKADLPSGFGIELPIHSDSISGVTGTRNLNDVVGFTAKGLESGIDESKPCVIVFDNYFGLISGAGNIKKSGDIDMVISFTAPVALSSIPVIEFNPFIFVNKDRSREVHLVNFSPTNKYNTNYRNAGADNGNYATVAGHPWALHMAHTFDPPKENVDITNAYLNFKTFVESGGGSNTNWYTTDEGNRSGSLIHLYE